MAPVKLDLDLDEVLAPGDLLVYPLLSFSPEVLLPPELGQHLVLQHVGHLLTARRLAARAGAGVFGDLPHLGTLSNALKLAVRLRVETAELYRGPAFHVFLKYYKLDLIFQICSNKLLKDAVRCLNQPR